VRIVSHRLIPDDSTLREQWNLLVDQMECPEVFYTHQWAHAVQYAYRDSLVPWLFLQYEGEELRGIVALATAQGTATFLSGTTADYSDFISHPADRASLVDAVFSELHTAGVKEIVLPNLPADSASVDALRSAARKFPYQIFSRMGYSCAQVRLGSDQDRQQLKTRLDKRKIFRRAMNVLVRQGNVTLRHRTTWDAIEPSLPEFSLAHVARFLATGRISNLASAKRRAFLTELARLLSVNGWLVLSQLSVGGSGIAWNYGFRFRSTWFWYQPTFDSQFEQISPGSCLLTKIIGEACDIPQMQTVDLGLGAEEYKERVANTARTTLHVTITSSWKNKAKAMMRYRAARAVKSWPALETQIRRGVKRLNSIRESLEKSSTQERLAWCGRRATKVIASREEVLFYEWTPASARTAQIPSSLRKEALTLEVLAQAAMYFEGDLQTEAYMLRAAMRLRSKATGFAFFNEEGVPVHFCWTAAFEGFYMAELKMKLNASSANDWLIFDCWTPHLVRGRGYYGMAVKELAMHLTSEARSPWIFSASSNQASLRGLAKTGFERRFSMVRRKVLMMQWVRRVLPMAHSNVEVLVGS